MTEKRYYWLKMQEDFFEQKEIKILRRIPGGDTYTIIYQKMLLKSLRTDGLLYYEGIGKDFADELSADIGEDVEAVRVTLNFLASRGLMFKGSKDEYEMSKIKLMVGSETSSAERMRRLREKQGSLPISNKKIVTLLQASDVDIEIDKEKEIDTSKTEIDIEIENVLSYLNSKTGKRFRSNSSKNVSLIRTLFKDGYNLNDIKKVIDLKVSDWLQDTKMNEYLRPSTLFNKNHFEEYLNKAPQGHVLNLPESKELLEKGDWR